MQINSPLNVRIVIDYDFIFESGMAMPITIDPFYGDTIQDNGDTYTIVLNAKPSKNDPDKMLPAEDVTVYVSKLISVQRRLREVTNPTPEQKADWAKTFKEVTGVH